MIRLMTSSAPAGRRHPRHGDDSYETHPDAPDTCEVQESRELHPDYIPRRASRKGR